MPEGPARTRGEPRGFALIIVLIIAVAALVATYGIVESSLNARVGVVRTNFGDLSEGIARAGLERAVAYLEANGAADFDWVLDPNQDSACNPPTGFVAGTEAFQPVFTEGSVVKDVEFPPGATERMYTLVPYNGGAYLIRFEDDADDTVSDDQSAQWASWTNNNTGTGDSDCVEGMTALSDPSSFNTPVENPVRDRNRAIWVEVIGIYPGTDVSNVRYKTVMRKRHTFVAPPTVTGMAVKGNINLSGTGTLYACSPVGSLEVDGNVTLNSGSSRMCASGNSLADDWHAGPGTLGHCTESTFTENCRVTPARGELEEPGPTPPAVTDPFGANSDFFVDWTRSCTFLIDQDGASEWHLWFWDADATRGPRSGGDPQLCSDFEGRNLGWPVNAVTKRPDPVQAGVASTGLAQEWAGCWTPLIIDMQDNTGAGGCQWAFTESGYTGPVEAADADEHDPGTGTPTGSEACAWYPQGSQAGSQAATISDPTDMNTILAGATGTSLFNAADSQLSYNKPDWQDACQIVYPPFPSASQTQEDYYCTTCDGTNPAFGWNDGWPYFKVKSDSTYYDRDKIRALPPGVYVWPTDWSLTGQRYQFDETLFPIPPTGNVARERVFQGLSGDGAPATDWPMATIGVRGDFNQQQDMWVGIGQDFAQAPPGNVPADCRADPGLCELTGAHYASMIGGQFGGSNGNISLQGRTSYAIAGSIYADGDLNWNGGNPMYLFGELHLAGLTGNFNLSGSGAFHWLYQNSLQQPPPEAGGAPLIHRARQ